MSWVQSCRPLNGVLGEHHSRGEDHLLQPCGSLSGVPEVGPGSMDWLHPPVAWEEHWLWQAAGEGPGSMDWLHPPVAWEEHWLWQAAGEGPGSMDWLHPPVAWEEDWLWQAAKPEAEGVVSFLHSS